MGKGGSRYRSERAGAGHQRPAREGKSRPPGIAAYAKGVSFDEMMAQRPGAPPPAPVEPEPVYRPCPACGEPDGLGAPSGLCRNLTCPSLNGGAT